MISSRANPWIGLCTGDVINWTGQNATDFIITDQALAVKGKELIRRPWDLRYSYEVSSAVSQATRQRGEWRASIKADVYEALLCGRSRGRDQSFGLGTSFPCCVCFIPSVKWAKETKGGHGVELPAETDSRTLETLLFSYLTRKKS